MRRWSAQSAQLAVMDDEELGRLVDRTPASGWGGSAATALPDGTPVFVKRLPLTELEHDHGHSTRNLFRLPAYYQYGVGSAGFGVWREVATHVKTTGWVVDGSCAAFPMLLHHRVMRRPAGTRADGGWVDTADYVAYWNNSKRIASFMEARRSSPYELWLVLEHVPHRMFEWLVDSPAAVGEVVDAQFATLRFLHDHGVFHFDAHFGNVVTDGATPFLTDFGLVTDRAFDLTATERAFVDAHPHYDFGETVYSVGNALLAFLMQLPEADGRALVQRFVDVVPRDHDALIDVLVENVDAIADDGTLGVTRPYADVVVRYRPVILFMSAFFAAMRFNRRKNTFFDDARLAALLRDAGAPLN